MEAQRWGPILGCFKFADRGCWVTAVHFHSPLRTHPHFNSSWCRWSGPWGQASPVSLACSAGTKRQVWKLACDSFFSDFERLLIVLVTVFTTDRWFSTKKKKKGQTALEKSLELGRMAESKCIWSILCSTGSSEGFPSFLQFWMAFVFEKKKIKGLLLSVCCQGATSGNLLDFCTCKYLPHWPLNLSVVYHGFSRGFCGSLLSIFRSKLSFKFNEILIRWYL